MVDGRSLPSCRSRVVLVNPAVPQCIIIFVIRFRNPSLLGGSSLSFACSKPVVAGWIVVVVCLWVCGRCRFWGWWSYCGGYIYFTLHDGRVLLPCASALCLSMLRWFLSKGTARRRDCASMRDWALCLACFERRCSSARSVKTGAVCRQAKIKRFRVSRGKSRCRDGVPRAHVTRCLVLRAEMCERKIIELQMSSCVGSHQGVCFERRAQDH